MLTALALGSPSPPDPPPIEWNEAWPRVDARDYAIVGGLFLSAFATRVLIPTQNGWAGTLFFDEPIRDWLRVEDPDTQLTITDVSDIFQLGVLAYPIVVDAAIIASLQEDNMELAEQLAIMDLESLGLTTFMIALSKAVVGRARPGVEPCPGSEDDFSCRNGISRQSFVSGHTAAAFTSAGLICVHHEHLNLYRSSWAGPVACAAGLALATVTGGLRVISDRHYASDVLGGAVLGLLSGYLLPKLVHFRERSHEAPRTGPILGQVDLSGLGGLSSFGDTPEGVGGARLAVRQQLPLSLQSLILDFAASARAIRSGQDSTEARLRGDLRLFYDAVGLGVAVDYFAERSADAKLAAFGLYPTLSVGYLERESMVLLSARWGRVLGEPYQEIGGRLELGVLSHVSVAVEVETRVPDTSGAEMPASTRFLGSLGGRLPW